jgi:hypothetical protein
MAAFDKMPENRTRKEHLQTIKSLKMHSPKSVYAYWLRYCPRISKKAIEEA